MKIKALIGSGIVAGALLASSLAGAAVAFDPETGEGFVGKGDVQTAFGWNNKQLQDNLGGVEFSYAAESTVVTEQSWECTNANNDNIQERERTTTTSSSTTGVVSSVARVKNQITGVNLSGWSGTPVVVPGATETEGPRVDSCPSGPWTLTTPAGDPEVISDESTGGLYATFNGTSVLIG